MGRPLIADDRPWLGVFRDRVQRRGRNRTPLIGNVITPIEHMLHVNFDR